MNKHFTNLYNFQHQVAEVFTGHAGKLVTMEQTIEGFKEILTGKYDHLPEVAFYMVGDISEVCYHSIFTRFRAIQRYFKLKGLPLKPTTNQFLYSRLYKKPNDQQQKHHKIFEHRKKYHLACFKLLYSKMKLLQNYMDLTCEYQSRPH